MNCNISASPEFLRNLKKLAKKYKSIKSDLESLSLELKNNPFIGTDLGNGLRKIRMAISSKGKGKRGGARVITYNLIVSEQEVCVELVSIYDKSEQETISDKELIRILRSLDM